MRPATAAPIAPSRWRALRHTHYRRWTAALAVSLVGTWCQAVTIAAVVVHHGGNGVDLALLTTGAALPTLALALWGGAVADRSGRATLIALQLASGVLALAVAIALATTPTITALLPLVVLQGCITAVDLPCRQRLVPDLVAPADLPSAIAVQGVVQMGGRAAGALMAGALLAAGAPAICGLVNAASCLVLASILHRLPADAFTAVQPASAARPVNVAGVRTVLADDALRTPLLMLFAVGGLALTTEVLLPLTAIRAGGAAWTGWLVAALAAGSLTAAWRLAGSDPPSIGRLARAAACLAVALCLLGCAPGAATALVAVGCAGRAAGLFVGGTALTLQASAPAAVRGRTMGLFAVAVNGTTPVGDPVIGLTATHAGLPAAYLLAASGAVAAAVLGRRRALATSPGRRPERGHRRRR